MHDDLDPETPETQEEMMPDHPLPPYNPEASCPKCGYGPESASLTVNWTDAAGLKEAHEIVGTLLRCRPQGSVAIILVSWNDPEEQNNAETPSPSL